MTMLLKLVLPFPPWELSPNVKIHWRLKDPIKKQFMAKCFEDAQAFKPRFGEGRIPASIMFYPPNKRADLDNMFSAMKFGLDSVARCWKINDIRFRPYILDCAEKGSPDFPRTEIYFKNVQF